MSYPPTFESGNAARDRGRLSTPAPGRYFARLIEVLADLFVLAELLAQEREDLH